MPRAYDDPSFHPFDDPPAFLRQSNAMRLNEIDERTFLRKFAPDTALPEPGASALQLGFWAAFNFILVFALCIGLWALAVTGGWSNADFAAIGREILGAIRTALSHLSPPTPSLPPTA